MHNVHRRPLIYVIAALNKRRFTIETRQPDPMCSGIQAVRSSARRSSGADGHRFNATTLGAARGSWNDEGSDKANPCGETFNAYRLGTIHHWLRLSIKQAGENAIGSRTQRKARLNRRTDISIAHRQAFG
jgi:hypothetical protein